MGIPKELCNTSDKHSVFLYCSSLWGQANDLTNLLKETEYWDVTDSKDVQKAEKHMAPIVWMVGHGLAKKSAMLNDSGGEVVGMDEIIKWCGMYGTKHLIDTGCYPASRLKTVNTLKPKFNYYCKKDIAKAAKSLGDYQLKHPPNMKDLDRWWDGEGQCLAYKP